MVGESHPRFEQSFGPKRDRSLQLLGNSLELGIVTERVPADMFDDARSHGSRPYDPAQHAVRPVERILTEA